MSHESRFESSNVLIRPFTSQEGRRRRRRREGVTYSAALSAPPPPPPPPPSLPMNNCRPEKVAEIEQSQAVAESGDRRRGTLRRFPPLMHRDTLSSLLSPSHRTPENRVYPSNRTEYLAQRETKALFPKGASEIATHLMFVRRKLDPSKN